MTDPTPGPPPALPPRQPPHQQLTDDGRRLREVRSYARRGHRFTPRQRAAWEAHHERWVVPDEAMESPDFAWADWFGPQRAGAAMVLEVGSGVGEATAALAAARPEADLLALEVWRPGIADTLWKLAESDVTNVRLCAVDAGWTLAHRLAPASLEEVWTFFPDPWPKTRHHKRRLVRADFAALVADRLVAGGTWRLATDWADYAAQMRAVLDAEPRLVGGPVERWAQRPVTRFERKGRDAGREITDLAYVAR